MASTSNDSIMSSYLVKFGAIRMSLADRRSDLLETLYMTDCYRAGKDLNQAKKDYDAAIWNAIPSVELDDRLRDLSQFMAAFARDRAAIWGARL